MNDSISQRLVAYLNSRMPRPEQVRSAVRAPMQAVGDAGEAVRTGGHDAMLGVMQFLAGHTRPTRRGLPGVNGDLVEGGGGMIPPHHVGVRW